jgi:multiple sugar transport system substrate-binding protein
MTALTGSTWSHPRGHDSILAATAAFVAGHPEAKIGWDARSLQDFADYSLAELAQRYDLLVFDHPFIGEAACSGLLTPLDQFLDASILADQEANSAGPSYASYAWEGHQWALAIDAACHVSAVRRDLAPQPPLDWQQALDMARQRKGSGRAEVAIPALPIDAFLALLTLMANAALEPFGDDGGMGHTEAAVAALEFLAELIAYAHPASLAANPIELLELMSTTDEVAYLPITFGYVTYSAPANRPYQVAFGPLPAGHWGVAGGAPGSGAPGSGVLGGVLGGAGMGVTARCADPAAAAEFAAFVASAAIQKGPYAAGGGQPGHAAAWSDSRLDASHGHFFSSTWPSIQNAYLRPRWPGYIAAQMAASELTHAWLVDGEGPASQVVRRLDQIFKRAYQSANSDPQIRR